MVEEIFDFWKFIAGIGIFLWGMNHLEISLKEMAGNSLRNLLQKFTNKGWKGIMIGAFMTTVLQSSSLVTLMVLAFLGGGIISLGNSLGVVLGANLGTTLTAWIIAAFGFKIDIASFSLPFLGIGSLLYLSFGKRPVLKYFGGVLMGFGLLFLGLDFMKIAIEAVAYQIDLASFSQYGLWVFVILGVVITGLIQSSTATIVIVLSALSVRVIVIEEAVALTIGANIGTTLTLVIGSIGGTADKKRLSLANVLFKSIAGILAYFIIDQLVYISTHVFKMEDPLMELALINTLFNLMGIILFYPFLKITETWLRKLFLSDEPKGATVFLKNVSTQVPGAAIAALEKELELVFIRTADFIEQVLGINRPDTKQASVWKRIIQQPYDLLHHYKNLKLLEDEITSYHIAILEENLTFEQAEQVTSLMLSLRTMIYSAKDIKDVMHNIREMDETENELEKELLSDLRFYASGQLKKFKYYANKRYKEKEYSPKKIVPEWEKENSQKYEELIARLYQREKLSKLKVSISTVTNVLKQLVSSLDNLGHSLIHRILKVDKVVESNGNGS